MEKTRVIVSNCGLKGNIKIYGNLTELISNCRVAHLRKIFNLTVTITVYGTNGSLRVSQN